VLEVPGIVIEVILQVWVNTEVVIKEITTGAEDEELTLEHGPSIGEQSLELLFRQTSGCALLLPVVQENIARLKR
jgi:hypothetical protein